MNDFIPGKSSGCSEPHLSIWKYVKSGAYPQTLNGALTSLRPKNVCVSFCTRECRLQHCKGTQLCHGRCTTQDPRKRSVECVCLDGRFSRKLHPLRSSSGGQANGPLMPQSMFCEWKESSNNSLIHSLIHFIIYLNRICLYIPTVHEQELKDIRF